MMSNPLPKTTSTAADLRGVRAVPRISLGYEHAGCGAPCQPGHCVVGCQPTWRCLTAGAKAGGRSVQASFLRKSVQGNVYVPVLPCRFQEGCITSDRAPARQASERSGQGRRRPSGPASAHAVLVWLQNDLRLDDHEALSQANGGGAVLLPVYVFDPRDFEKVNVLTSASRAYPW